MKTKRAGLLMVVLMALSVVACAQSRIEKTLPLQPGGQFVLQSPNSTQSHVKLVISLSDKTARFRNNK